MRTPNDLVVLVAFATANLEEPIGLMALQKVDLDANIIQVWCAPNPWGVFTSLLSCAKQYMVGLGCQKMCITTRVRQEVVLRRYRCRIRSINYEIDL